MTPKPDYGIDAPGLRRGMFAAGLAGGALAGLAAFASLYSPGRWATGAVSLAGLAGIACLYGFGMASYMTYVSRIGKLRTRERLLDCLQGLAPWTGHETVLDVGCGRGLMLVGAARRLTTGMAVGVDLWRAEDQTDNTPEAAFENARREGVAARISIETGDARALAYPEASFDWVLSHWVVHNIKDAKDRTRALEEMWRVLRPGGVLVLADIANFADYKTQLAAHDLRDVWIFNGGWETRIIGVLSGGSFRPQAIVGRKALG